MLCEKEAEKKDKDEAKQTEELKLDAGRRIIGNAAAGEAYSDSHGTDVDNENCGIPVQDRKCRRPSGRSQPRFEDGFAAFGA